MCDFLYLKSAMPICKHIKWQLPAWSLHPKVCGDMEGAG